MNERKVRAPLELRNVEGENVTTEINRGDKGQQLTDDLREKQQSGSELHSVFEASMQATSHR